MLSRRQFLTAGLAGSAVLACGAWFYGARKDAAELEALYVALSAAFLQGAIPAEAQTTRLRDNAQAIGVAVSGLAPAAQQELAELFGLLVFPPTRFLLTGVSSSWSAATLAATSAFLQRWRDSRIDLLKAAYAALHDLVLGAWYADPANWNSIAYPGPPPLRAS